MDFNEFIRFFTFDLLVITNFIALYKTRKSLDNFIKFHENLGKDMDAVMTSYEINISQLCDLIDVLFEIKKDVGK